MKTLITLILGFSIAGSLHSAERSWTGGSAIDGNWSHSDNWDVAPVSGDSLLFDGGPKKTQPPYVTANINDLAVGTAFSGITFTGYNFNLGTSSNRGNRIKLNGPIVRETGGSSVIYMDIELLSDTEISVLGTLEMYANDISGNYGIIKTGSGTLTLRNSKTFTGGVILNEGTLKAAGTNNGNHFGSGLLTINGGVLDLIGANTTVLGGLSGSGGEITTSGGSDRTFTLDSSASTSYAGTLTDGVAKLAFTKAGTGTLTLTGASTYKGATTINGGTLLVNGSLGNTAVTVAAGGTLGGTGTIQGNTLVNGILAPGNSPGELTFSGDLTLDETATYRFEGGDLVTVTGTLSLNDNWTLSLQSGFQDGGQVMIFNYGTLGTFNNVLNWDLSNLGFTPSTPLTLTDTGSSIVLHGISVIPEPSALLLLGLAAAATLVFRRRL